MLGLFLALSTLSPKASAIANLNPFESMNHDAYVADCRRKLSHGHEMQRLSDDARTRMRVIVLRDLLLTLLPRHFNSYETQASGLAHSFVDDAAWVWNLPIQSDRIEGIERLMRDILLEQKWMEGEPPSASLYFEASSPKYSDPPDTIQTERQRWLTMIQALRGLRRLAHR